MPKILFKKQRMENPLRITLWAPVLGVEIEENRCRRHQKFRKSQENLHFSPIAFLRDFCNRLYRHGSGNIEKFLLPLICHQPVGYTGESEGRATVKLSPSPCSGQISRNLSQLGGFRQSLNHHRHPFGRMGDQK